MDIIDSGKGFFFLGVHLNLAFFRRLKANFGVNFEFTLKQATEVYLMSDKVKNRDFKKAYRSAEMEIFKLWGFGLLDKVKPGIYKINPDLKQAEENLEYSPVLHYRCTNEFIGRKDLNEPFSNKDKINALIDKRRFT
jgi:hypothetical protein